MNPHFERAQLLLAQSRYDLAERELRQHLGAEPNDPVGHAMLASCLLHQERYADATAEAEAAVGLGPDLAFTHYALADVLFQRHHYPEAAAAIRTAIELDPADADYRALRAGIHFSQHEWSEALASAEAGLEFDPEHVTCNNMRAMALVKLGRRAEAGQTLDSALARDPDNASTHANQGWTYLEKGDTRKALEHFREALRLEPDSEWARQGVLEALRAQNPIYRLFLIYFLWMAKLGPRLQFGVIIGGYIGNRVLSGIVEEHPQWGPYLWPIVIAYVVFAVLTWTAKPIFNLLLWLNRFGRLVLSEDEKRASMAVGVCLLAAFACVGWWFVSGGEQYLGGLIFTFLMIPVSATFELPSGGRRVIAAVCLALLILLGPGGFALFSLGVYMKSKIFMGGGYLLMISYFYGILAFSFLLNFMRAREPRL